MNSSITNSESIPVIALSVRMMGLQLQSIIAKNLSYVWYSHYQQDYQKYDPGKEEMNIAHFVKEIILDCIIRVELHTSEILVSATCLYAICTRSYYIQSVRNISIHN